MVTSVTGDPIGQVSSQTDTLSPWAAPYVGDMLSKGQALANLPYQAYTGPISAGASDLQQQAFQGLGSLTLPTAATAGSFTAPGMAQQYMNPYINMALQPQMEEARRQSQIEQQRLQGQYSRAGAYGGGRQAVAEAELSGALQRNLANIYGTGMQQAYDRAADLFGQERDYGLKALEAQQLGGATQRDIEQQGIAANIAQFEEERDYPYKQLQFQQSLLQDLPIQQIQRDYVPQSDIAKWLGIIGGVGQAGKDFMDFWSMTPWG